MHTVSRNVGVGRYKITEVVGGLETSVALNTLYGHQLMEVLKTTWIDVVSKPWQIWVDRDTRRITVNQDYLAETETETLYLDFIHELVHLWQLSVGADVFDRSVSYVDSPTEIEAYRYTLEDAKRLGFSQRDLVEYLKVRWITDDEHRRLVKAVLG